LHYLAAAIKTGVQHEPTAIWTIPLQSERASAMYVSVNVNKPPLSSTKGAQLNQYSAFVHNSKIFAARLNKIQKVLFSEDCPKSIPEAI
jgi:hypothetical protein